ncbi:hypothetical protein PtB15_18B354 [Puccinia triticina]|nr:hypothetical protein PtB15_18B354 [Puccinia triticina]
MIKAHTKGFQVPTCFLPSSHVLFVRVVIKCPPIKPKPFLANSPQISHSSTSQSQSLPLKMDASSIPRSPSQTETEESSTTPPPKWEETGVVPVEEEIKVVKLTQQIPAASTHQSTLRKPPRKRSKKKSTVKPVNLLSNTPDPSTSTAAPTNQPPVPNDLVGPLPHDSTARPPSPSPSTFAPGGEVDLPADSGAHPTEDQAELAAATSASASVSLANSTPVTNPTPPGGPTSLRPSNTPQSNHLPPEAPKEGQNTSNTNATGNQPPDLNAGHPCPLTIIESEKICKQVVEIHHTFNGSKPLWAKYQSTWNSLGPLIASCARFIHNPPPKLSIFYLQRTACSHTSWMDTITSLADKFLSHSQNKQWYCPDILNFPLLLSFGNKEKENPLQSEFFIPTVNKSQHSESTIVQCLFPPASLMIISGKVLKPSVTLTPSGAHYLALTPQWTPTSQQLHSVNVLHEFRNVIINFLMAYLIFQTHHLSKSPMTTAHKKAASRAN